MTTRSAAGGPVATHVAFFRNMNLGQARSHSPTRPVLEGAFTAAGVSTVRSFQTNGTVLFDPGAADPVAVVERARAALRDAVGYTDIAPVQPVRAVAGLVAATRTAVAIDLSLAATFFDPELDASRLGSAPLSTGSARGSWWPARDGWSPR